ncbi:hypothetical protein FGG08_001163 [Glutinoglossum americanum]|uniref:Uncharacterized protein n=1 Tax=Glutinoglossum americanum TaxID=1670608 RepID=A0A9P8IH60_9PEZI|nr:hypothetical protein FGG08_001163 [Glutinoglossum americanum]
MDNTTRVRSSLHLSPPQQESRTHTQSPSERVQLQMQPTAAQETPKFTTFGSASKGPETVGSVKCALSLPRDVSKRGVSFALNHAAWKVPGVQAIAAVIGLLAVKKRKEQALAELLEKTRLEEEQKANKKSTQKVRFGGVEYIPNDAVESNASETEEDGEEKRRIHLDEGFEGGNVRVCAAAGHAAAGNVPSGHTADGATKDIVATQTVKSLLFNWDSDGNATPIFSEQILAGPVNAPWS